MADDELSLDSNSSEKAQLDTEELGGGGGTDYDKVELDLEDAPFLEEEEDEPESEEDAAPLALDDEEKGEDDRPLWLRLVTNWKIAVPAGAVMLLLVGLLVFFFFLPSDEMDLSDLAKEQQAQQEEQAPAEEAEAVPEEVVEPEPMDFVVSMEPFWVEHKEEDGKVVFLHCKLSASTTNEKLAWEMRSKKIQLRDAIFYYLRNKDLMFLSDKENVEALKKDLLGVMNQYLSNDQLDTLLIEEYLVK